jgi:hypothetical protein
VDARLRSDNVGRFLELDPARRLVIVYGWQDNLMGIPPESTTVEGIHERVNCANLALSTSIHRPVDRRAPRRTVVGMGREPLAAQRSKRQRVAPQGSAVATPKAVCKVNR